MRIKTFQGRSLEEVLPEIRAELGAGAVVIGQRTKVQGGVAGFFGTKVIEVTAADRMPSDDQLVDLEDQLMGGAAADAGASDGGGDLAQRFAGAMRMGRRGGIDVTDEWDPSQDAELANEYGRVLEHAATAGFSEMDVPVANAAPATTPLMPPPAAHDPLAQAQALAARTHRHVQGTTQHLDEAVYAPQMGGYAPPAPAAAAAPTYAPPRPLPNSTPVEERARTFAASVLDTPMQAYEPAAVTDRAASAGAVDDALRADLYGGVPSHDPIDAAVEMIDLKAMAALRNAMHATRRMPEEAAPLPPYLADIAADPVISRLSDHLTQIGVDADVIEALADTALHHRRPFGGEQDVEQLMHGVIEDAIDVRTGFPRTGGCHRMALVGASSSGKTTVAAKLAHGYVAAGMRVGLLSIIAGDPKVAVAGDSRFRGLDIDVRYAATAEQAIDGAEAFAAHDLLIVDTPGATYLDNTIYAQVQTCLTAIGIDAVHVVMPLATSSREAHALVDAFRPMGADRMVVSRLDESRYVGQLLNFGFRLGVPMTYLSSGPDVSSDLYAASSRQITQRIMPDATSHS